jgi:hypothetical protein
MRILVVGAGETGAAVIRQLKKNPAFEIVVADAREDPPAVRRGVIDRVDYRESLTPLNMEHLLKRVSPDLVLLAASARDLIDPRVPGADLLARALGQELATNPTWPVIPVDEKAR